MRAISDRRTIVRKLNTAAVQKIRDLSPALDGATIARRFGVSKTLVYKILHGKYWKQVKA